MYQAVDPKVSFPAMETEILADWKRERVFERSVTMREGAPEFVFFDGPPFATGLPHFGHFVPGTIKDIVPRYQTMRGKRVVRRFGWDTHGLPVEYEMERELGISGAEAIERYGVAEFNEACRGIVLRYTAEWREIMTRMGRWVDFDNDYKTMDPNYMETIWWVIKRLHEKGLLYQGHYILPYSPALATPLSNFEVNLGGYHDVDDPAVTVRFRLKGRRNTSILAWTTTPWTLPSNLALAVGADIEYARVVTGDETYIVAAERLGAYYRNATDYRVVGRVRGSELVGAEYEPIFPYFARYAADGAFRVHAGDFVTTDEGTGVVHIAPGFGEDDYRLLAGTGLPVIVPIDRSARFTNAVPDFAGLQVKAADKEIIQWLRERGHLFKRETYRHSYPFCYRSREPLIYRAIDSWFVNVTKIKARMLAANETVAWVPGHIQRGRFGKWLEGARDWAISRNRYWGNPIPVWKSDAGDHIEVIGSREELAAKSGVWVEDLHKHHVDRITWPSPDGKGTMRRVPEVLDCWFESGAMPYGQAHYPFEHKDRFERNFPADFICEGMDQTRGWFYTLAVLAAALFDRPAFRNVIVNGLVLASDGKKMSKSLRNYTDPVEVIDRFGADALRLFLINSSVVRAEDLKYSDDGVREVLKTTLIPWWNAYSFFVTYANIDAAQPTAPPGDPTNPLDRWVLSELQRLIVEVRAALDAYDLQRATGPIVRFVDQLNNWYIRRSRRRFWRAENDADKGEAYATLHHVLLTLAQVAAPIVPFVTEAMYRNLRAADLPASVHLCDYPQPDPRRRDVALETRMATTQQAVGLGRAIRTMDNLRVRQPLAALHVVTRDATARATLREMQEILIEELNVKTVLFRDNEDDLVEYSAKANFRKLGPVLGPRMRSAAGAIEALGSVEIRELLDGSTLSLEIDGGAVDVTIDSVIVNRAERDGLKVLNEGALTIGIDPVITPELRQEGMVRDLIRAVQTLRKQRGLEVSDRIRLSIGGDGEIIAAVTAFRDYLTGETLAAELITDGCGAEVEVEVGQTKVHIGVDPVR